MAISLVQFFKDGFTAIRLHVHSLNSLDVIIQLFASPWLSNLFPLLSLCLEEKRLKAQSYYFAQQDTVDIHGDHCRSCTSRRSD